MTAKYIILAGAHPVLFRDPIRHVDAARIAMTREAVTSAGYWERDATGFVHVWGSAQTLDDLEAQPEDAALIERLFRE